MFIQLAISSDIFIWRCFGIKQPSGLEPGIKAFAMMKVLKKPAASKRPVKKPSGRKKPAKSKRERQVRLGAFILCFLGCCAQYWKSQCRILKAWCALRNIQNKMLPTALLDALGGYKALPKQKRLQWIFARALLAMTNMSFNFSQIISESWALWVLDLQWNCTKLRPIVSFRVDILRMSWASRVCRMWALAWVWQVYGSVLGWHTRCDSWRLLLQCLSGSVHWLNSLRIAWWWLHSLWRDLD